MYCHLRALVVLRVLVAVKHHVGVQMVGTLGFGSPFEGCGHSLSAFYRFTVHLA